MNILSSEENYNKPCCIMLKEKAKSRSSLVAPTACTELLSCIASDCVLMKAFGNSVKVDQQYAQCYLLLDPTEARQILNEVSETITLEGLTDYYGVLNQIESRIAKNPLRDEIADHHALLLAILRKGESKFGAVPHTIEKKPLQSPELSDTQKFFLDHPKLADKPQFDGVPPTQTPIPNDNPSSAEQVNRLQNQHQPKPAFNPRPQV